VSRPALGPTQPPVQWVPGVLSTGVKARPGCNADHSPPSKVEVENEYELYLLSPQAPPWRVAGLLYLFRTEIQDIIKMTLEVYSINMTRLKVAVFWERAPRSLVEVHRRFRRAYYRHHLCSLTMEAVRTSETTIYFNETTRHHTPEDCHFHTCRLENLKSRNHISCLRTGVMYSFFTDWLVMMGETMSQNCGHQLAYCSSPRWYVSVESHGGDDAGWG
jgi:hypothetical protein